MVLTNQNAKLTGPDQGFLVSPSSSYESPGNEVAFSNIKKLALTFIPVIVTKVRDIYFWMLRTCQEYGWNKKVQPMIFVAHCCLSNQQDRSEKI